MEGLPEPLLAEIIKRITRTSDLNALSLVSKHLYNAEAEERVTIRVGCGLHPATKALSSLCFRFPNLWKVEINYSGWTSKQGRQLDNRGILVLSSRCPLLTDLTLSFCSYINDTGIGYLANCKRLKALRLKFAPAISSSGLLSVAVGCKSLSAFHLVDCMKVGSVEWLEYLGRAGSVVELVVKDCKGIKQYDLLKFGQGWMKLENFEFQISNCWLSGTPNPSYGAQHPYKYDLSCENLKDLRLAHIIPVPMLGHIVAVPHIGFHFLLRKCKALERLCLHYVTGLEKSDMIALFQNCSNLRSFTLHEWPTARMPLTDKTLVVLSRSCPMLEVVELYFPYCSNTYLSEIGLTQGIVMLVQFAPVRVLTLNGIGNFGDEGMRGLSSAQFLETLMLADCEMITDSGISFLSCTPSLSNLTLQQCNKVCLVPRKGVKKVL
jgi:F-box/leucine-rich repeat protein 2/20